NRSLRDLHVFRSIAHVIDMHQLTKDPSIALASEHATASSPQRTMTPFELTRYLDYCGEMLSLTSKLAAVYAQNLPDPVVVDAVYDIESLTTNLSQKIWQKITLVDSSEGRSVLAASQAKHFNSISHADTPAALGNTGD